MRLDFVAKNMAKKKYGYLIAGLFIYQSGHPRFHAENLEKNKNIYDRIQSLAKKHQCTPPQLALAWVLQQGNDVVPIPGK